MPRQRRATASPSRPGPVQNVQHQKPQHQHSQPVPVAPAPTAIAQPVQSSSGPGLMAQMAATAGSVAVGSAVGHTVGHAITSMFSSGSSEASSNNVQPQQVQPQQQVPIQQPQQQQQPIIASCDRELQQFIKCTQEQNDLSLCAGYNELLKECKMRYNA